MIRKTKIVCTLGPASDSEEMISKLMDAGMNVCRLNMSHGSYEEQGARIDRIKRLRAEKNIPVAIMLDTKGPEVRLKDFADGRVHLTAGQEFTLTTVQVEGDAHCCSITYGELPGDVKAGDTILLDDGLVRLTVLETSETLALVTAGGLFHYFEESKVVGLLRMLTGFGEIEIVFDSVSKSGMAMMRKKYMKQVGHGDAQMFFYVDSASVLAGKIGSEVRVLAEEPYYRHIPRTGLKLSTKISMAVSDRFCMVKMVHLCHSAKFHD